MAEKLTLQDLSKERRIFLSRILIAAVIVVLLFLLLLARLIHLQVFEHEYYSSKSDNYRIHIQSVPPTRGLIYDRNGILLAENVPAFSLVLVKEHSGDVETVLERLQGLVDLSQEDIDKFYTRFNQRQVPFSSTLLKFNLSEEEMARIAVNQFRLPGVSVEAQLVRHYPLGDIFAHSVGYLGSISEEELRELDAVDYSGTNQIGKMGVERFYEDLLHGTVGYETVEKNARGQIMKVLDRTDPVPGQDIVLNLDAHLQLAALNALGEYRGAIVALDPDSGGVLSMVSNPGFDPNLFAQGISRQDFEKLRDPVLSPMFNRALAGYSPGSTVKPFVGLAGLDYGIRTREYTIDDPGYFELDGTDHVYHDWTWWGSRNGHGRVNLEKAVYQSCDIYFYDLATDMGIDLMHDFLFRFGFGRNTSVDIQGARSGTLPSREWKRNALGEVWYPGETLNSAIGQGYTLATPLQLATATMVLANRGDWHQPMMLRQVGLNGEEIAPRSQIPDIRLNNPDDWSFIHQAMEKVVHRGDGGYRDNGTAYAYLDMENPLEYRMAGKSGTAQVVGIARDHDGNTDEVPERYRDHALFIAFAPVEDPEIAVAVFVEHGEGGSSVAGPIARQVIDSYLLRDEDMEAPLQLTDNRP